MWMFQKSPDVDADISMMLEHRTEVGDDAKHVQTILGSTVGQKLFAESDQGKALKEHFDTVKAVGL